MSFEIKYKKKYVAFIDVLGFSALVEKKDQTKLEDYFSIIENAFKFFDAKKKRIKKLIISDSIILTSPGTENGFYDILVAIGVLQTFLAPYGIWVRGGVTFGEVFEDTNKHIIVGPGYIRAYLLEQEAIYPRIIIDPSILSRMKLNRQQFYEKCNANHIADPLKYKIIHDYSFARHNRYTQDDALFVSYANALILYSFADKFAELWVDKTYLHIKKGLYGEQKHNHKYLWLKKYFLESLEELDFYTNNKSPHKPILKKYIADYTAL